MSPQTPERGSGMVGMRRKLVAVLVAAVIAPVVLSGCGDNKKPAAWVGTPGSAAPSASGAPIVESAAVPVELAITPAAGKKDVPVSAEVGLKVTGGKVTSVTLTDSAGKTVSGALRDDGSSWVP